MARLVCRFNNIFRIGQLQHARLSEKIAKLSSLVSWPWPLGAQSIIDVKSRNRENMQYGEFCIPSMVWKRILKFRHWNVECGAELPESRSQCRRRRRRLICLPYFHSNSSHRHLAQFNLFEPNFSLVAHASSSSNKNNNSETMELQTGAAVGGERGEDEGRGLRAKLQFRLRP